MLIKSIRFLFFFGSIFFFQNTFCQKLLELKVALPANPDMPSLLSSWSSNVSQAMIFVDVIPNNKSVFNRQPQINSQLLNTKILVRVMQGKVKFAGIYMRGNAPNLKIKGSRNAYNVADILNFIGEDKALQIGNFELEVSLYDERDNLISDVITKSFRVSKIIPCSEIGKAKPNIIGILPKHDYLLDNIESTGQFNFEWTSGGVFSDRMQYKLKIYQIDSKMSESITLKEAPFFEKVIDSNNIFIFNNIASALQPSSGDTIKLIWKIEAFCKDFDQKGNLIINPISQNYPLQIFRVLKPLKTKPVTPNLQPNKKYKNGDDINLSNGFILKLDGDPIDSMGYLTGRGVVEVKWLDYLNVQFSKIKVDNNNKLEYGNIRTVNGSNIDYPVQFAANTQLGSWAINTIKQVAQNINSKPLIKATNVLNSIKKPALNMPLGYFQDGEKSSSLGFTEMVFMPTKATFTAIAYLNASKIFKDIEATSLTQTEGIGLIGENIEFTNAGLQGVSGALKLAEDIKVMHIRNLNDTFYITYHKDNDNVNNKHIGNAIVFGGQTSKFWKYKMDATIEFSSNFLIPKDKTKKTVDLNFQSILNKWDDFILQTKFPACTFANSNGMGIDTCTAVFDHSVTANIPNMKLPLNYMGQDSAVTFSGLYINKLMLTLPDGLRSYKDTSKQIKIGANNLILSKEGITFAASAFNVINYPDANIGNMLASIDTVRIKCFKTNLTEASMKGKITLPLSNGKVETSVLNYKAIFTPDGSSVYNENKFSFTLSPSDTQAIASNFLGDAKIQIFKSSSMELKIEKARFLNRNVKVDLSLALNGRIFYPIENLLNTKTPINLDCNFQGLKLNYFSFPNDSISFDPGIWSFASPQKSFSGFNFAITNVAPFVETFKPGSNLLFKGGIKLDALINIGAVNSNLAITGKTSFKFKASIETVNFNSDDNSTTSKINYGYLSHLKPAFLGISMEKVAIDIKTAVVDLKGSLAFYNNDATWGNGFDGKLEANFKTPNLAIGVGAKFANTDYITGNMGKGFKCWMVQAQTTLPSPGLIFTPGLAFRGFGVGVYSKMKMDVPDVYIPNSSEALTFNGATFKPDNNVLFGFKAKAIIATSPNEETFNSDVSLSGEFSSSSGLEYLKFDGNFACGSKIGQSATAFAQGAVAVKYDIVNNIFDLKTFLNLDIRNKGIQIYTRDPVNTVLHINGKTNNWYFKSGVPTNPMNINVLGTQTNSYLMFGNYLGNDVPNGFMQITKNGWSAAGLSPLPFIDNATAENKYQTGKGFAFGVAVNSSGSFNQNIFKYGAWTCKGDNFLDIKANYVIGGEINATLLKFNGNCVGFSNNWRAGVSAALYASASFSYEGSFPWNDCNVVIRGNLFTFRAGAYAITEFPNPSYLNAKIEGNYSIGKFKGTISKNIEVGTKCNSAEVTYGNAATKQKQNVLSDLDPELIGEIVTTLPKDQNSRNVELVVILKRELSNNTITLQEAQGDGTTKSRTFRVNYSVSLKQDSSLPLGKGDVKYDDRIVYKYFEKVYTLNEINNNGININKINEYKIKCINDAASSKPNIEFDGYDNLGACKWKLVGSKNNLDVKLKANTTYLFNIEAFVEEQIDGINWIIVKKPLTNEIFKQGKYYCFKTSNN